MDKKKKILEGKSLKCAYTLNTMYANNKIELQNKAGKIFRIDVAEILILLQREKFVMEMQRKYVHLKLVEAPKGLKDELCDALNHLDEMADRGADEGEEKRDLEKSYGFLFDFIISKFK
jgi:hypothetical protein